MRAISEQMHNGVYCVVVQGNCAVCSKQKTLYIPESEWLDWRNDAGRHLDKHGRCEQCGSDQVVPLHAPQPQRRLTGIERWKQEVA